MNEKTKAPNPLQGGGQCVDGNVAVDQYKDTQNAASTQPESAGYLAAINAELTKEEIPYKDTYYFDKTKEYPERTYLFRKDGIPFFPLGALSLINAKAKNGKTQFAQILVASFLGCTSFGIDTNTTDNRPIIYIDTEQDRPQTAVFNRVVEKCCGGDNDRLVIFNVTLADIYERMTVTENVICRFKPAIVIIDNVGDLTLNFNEIEGSTAVVQKLLNLATDYDCNICCVLHQNKNAEDKNPKGHLGTMLLQKCADVFAVERKSGGIFTASETDARGHADVGETTWSLCDGVPCSGSQIIEAAADATRAELREKFATVFGDRTEMQRKDLKAEYCKKFKCAERSAETAITKAVTLGVISKVGTAQRDPYKLN